jgi:hypothetical protein
VLDADRQKQIHPMRKPRYLLYSMLDREFRTIAVKKRISEEQQFIHRIAQLFDPNLLILKQNLGF